MSALLPRLVIAAPASGHGKTTVATGLMAALRREGLVVAPFKVGPDYIDPGYHALATGRPGRNLDPFLCGEALIEPLLLHGAATPEPADVAVIEGVMGLFDGRIGGDGFASTAHVAALTRSPVVLVLDISHTSRTAAAVVHGLTTFDPEVRVAGVILNKAASERHTSEVVSALESTGVPVLGVLPRDAGVEAPSRHLGLVPAEERAEAAVALDRLASHVAERVDLQAVLGIAHRAAPLEGAPWNPAAVVRAPRSGERPVVAVAGGRAFTFRYAETEELLYAAGLAPTVFDPLSADGLPEGTAGLYLGGGFPEVHAAGLAANHPLREAVRGAVLSGIPTVAECAGLLYLCESVDGTEMTGALPLVGRMGPRLTLGYRDAVLPSDSLLGPAGMRVTGHEFHRTTVSVSELAGSRYEFALESDEIPRTASRAGWLLDGRPDGLALDPAGTGRPTVHASYLHTHWAGHPKLAQAFADAVHHTHSLRRNTVSTSNAPVDPSFQPRNTVSTSNALVDPSVRLRNSVSIPVRTASAATAVSEAAEAVDLSHHGDRDVAPGLVDLAVNVRLAGPPPWLADLVAGTISRLGTYPDTAEATRAIAVCHGVPEEAVLPTSGGAEAFTLLARALPWNRPLVVHPQFTEPEAALRAAGHLPLRHVLSPADDFILQPGEVDTTADLVVIGNPTNPTGVLHPAEHLRRLQRPGRVLVVDEAFMDAVPGETESLIGGDLTGILVLRSLTKTWGLAGLRAGYVVGDPDVVAKLRAVQSPWSVSSPAVAATIGCLSERAVNEAAEAALEIAAHRSALLSHLASTSLRPVAGSRAPFVLVDSSAVSSESLRPVLADRGFAVRRGETFPGLGPHWIRLAVRSPGISAALCAAIIDIERSHRAS